MRPEYKGSKGGFPIRRSLDQSSFAAPQGLSQRTTSFIASQRLGIHQMLLRHLITLMINVRSAKTEHRSNKKDLFLACANNMFLLARHLRRPTAAGRGLVRGTRLSAGRRCRLFTISNIRAHPHARGGEFL